MFRKPKPRLSLWCRAVSAGVSVVLLGHLAFSTAFSVRLTSTAGAVQPRAAESTILHAQTRSPLFCGLPYLLAAAQAQQEAEARKAAEADSANAGAKETRSGVIQPACVFCLLAAVTLPSPLGDPPPEPVSFAVSYLDPAETQSATLSWSYPIRAPPAA